MLYLYLQLIDIMGSLLERPLIKKDFDAKYPVVVDKMHEMLDEAKLMYNVQVRTHNYSDHIIFKWEWFVNGKWARLMISA